DLCIASNGLRRVDSDFMILGRQSTNRPDPRHAQWLYAEMVGAGQTAFEDETYYAAASVYRPDLYDAATGETHRNRGENWVTLKVGTGFEENDPKAYLANIGR